MRIRPSLWIVGLALLSIPAHGESPLEPPELSRFLRWGPVRVRPGFVLSNLGYEDNVFCRSNGELSTRPRVGDTTITLSPRLEGVLLLGSYAFTTFTERLDYTAYQHQSQLNYFNQFGSLRTTFPFRRMGLFVEGDFNRTKDRPLDQQDIRNQQTERRLGAGFVFLAGWRTEVEIENVASGWSNRDPDGGSLADRLDRKERGNRARLGYLAFGRTKLTIETSRKTITFDDPSLNRNSRERRLLPGIEFTKGGRLTGVLRAGRARLTFDSGTAPDYSGTIGEASLAYRIGGGTTLRVGGRRQVAFAVYEANQYYLDSATEVSVVHYINRVFGLEAGGSWGTLAFSDGVRRDRITRYDGGVRVRLAENALGRRVEYTLKFAQTRRDSTIPGLDQSRGIFGFGAVLGY